MKKLVSVVSAAAIVAAASMSVFATEVTPDASGSPTPTPVNTTVNLGVNPTYTVTIPANIALETENNDGTRSGSCEIKAEDVILNKGKQIKVTVTSDFKLETTEGAILTYQMKKGNPATEVANGDTVAEFETDNSVTIDFSTTTAPQYAGEYTDTVVFNISVE